MLSQHELLLQEYLCRFLSPQRLQRIHNVAGERTRYIACVLEDLFDPRNASAVLRHCDALGVHEVHTIENRHHFKSDHQVDLGSAQWLDITRHHETRSNSAEAMEALKNRGYRIVATSPHGKNDAIPETLDIAAGPIAVVFGTEKHGISDIVRESADVFLRIPMVGFVESFNISASAAIVFYSLTQRLRNEGIDWRLSDNDRERLIHDWILRGTPHAEMLIERFESGGADR